MQYKLIYRPYDLSSLIENAKGKDGTYQASNETKDWNTALNNEAKDGWKVRNSGAIELGSGLIVLRHFPIL